MAILEKKHVTAYVENEGSFISGFNINFTVTFEPKSGDTAECVAKIWLDSILKPDTKVKILSAN